jgi:hypothetical protein
VVGNAELDQQEVLHGSLSGNSSVDFSGYINLDLCLLGNGLFLLDFQRGLFGYLKRLDEREVLQNGLWISI